VLLPVDVSLLVTFRTARRVASCEYLTVRGDIIGLVLCAFVFVSCDASEAMPSDVGCDNLVFTSNREGNPEIYTMTNDGVKRETYDQRQDVNPHWSPDGQRIVFASDRDGDFDLYLIDQDGGNLVNLTDNDILDSTASFAPDGSSLAVDSDGGSDVLQISTLEVETAERVQLTFGPPNGKPVWSPDGSSIAFLTLRDGNQEIYVMAVDGSSQTNLTHTPDSEVLPAWSPDGDRLAYSAERDGNWDIFVMNADGAEPTRLTRHPGRESNPTWSTDGTHVLYSSDRGGHEQIFAIRLDGTGETYLTDGFVSDCSK
jgi:Tol biopolymer transport system component